MTAQLDGMNHYGELNGGANISDPRLQRRLDLIPPHRPVTAEERAVVATAIARSFPVDPMGEPRENLQARLDLLQAIFGSPNEFQEAA